MSNNSLFQIIPARATETYMDQNKEEITRLPDGKPRNDGANHAISLHEETLVIKKKSLLSMTLVDLGVQGCDHFLQHLKKINKHTLGDLPNCLDGIHEDMDGVGPGTVEKFFDQLPHLLKKQAPFLCNDFGENVIQYNGQRMIIPEELLEIELNPSDFPGSTKAIEMMIENGMKTFRDLPRQFSSLTRFKGIGKVRVKRIYERLKIVIEQEKKQLALEKLSIEERLAYEINQFIAWTERISQSAYQAKREKVPFRYIQLLMKRYEAAQAGEHLTLQDLGDSEGVTRERIRQILLRGNKRIRVHWEIIEILLKERLHNEGDMIIDDYFAEMTFPCYVMLQALEHSGIYMKALKDIHIFTTKNEESLTGYMNAIKNEIGEIFAKKWITKEDFYDYCVNRSIQDNVHISIIENIAANEVCWLDNDQGVLANLSKVDAVEMVMLRYPEGVAIYKEEDVLNEQANELLPGTFKVERDFTEVLGRSDIDEKLVLWGRGVYIHTNFITNDENWVKEVQEIALQLLEEEAFIHVGKLFELVKEEALSRQVPNEYALFSLMRRFDLGYLSLERFPNIQRLGEGRQNNRKWVSEYIQAQGRPVSVEELTDVFINNRGWRRFTLEQILSRSTQIIQYQHGVYTLIDYYEDIQKEDLIPVIDWVYEQLAQKTILSIRSAYMTFAKSLKPLNVKTPNILYAVLKRLELEDITFIRFPYVTTSANENDTLPGKILVEDYIKEQNRVVSRDEIDQWLKQLLGESESLLDFALLHSKQILYYSRGQHGKYVHRNTIHMDEKREDLLQKVVHEQYKKITKQKGRTYAVLKELYTPRAYPELPHEIAWSEELLGDILKQSNVWRTIGSYGEIIIPQESMITNELDFVNYVLVHHFNGCAKLDDIQAFLADIRFSRRGQLLQVVEESVERGEAPFVIEENEMVHKQRSHHLIR